MTEREKIERELIFDILAESSRWRISEEDQDDDCIRLEVMDRARRLLLGIETVDANGYAQSHPDNLPVEDEDLTGADYQALEAAKLTEHLSNKAKTKRKWASKRVRVVIDGKPTWKLRSDCHKEVMPGWQTKMHWVWNGTDDKQEQCDAMWAEHEQGEEV